jgi:hypothetical protein
MKTIIEFKCEICNKRYKNKIDAQECEAKGVPKLPPVGLIYGDHRKSAFYTNMTFAIEEVKIKDHYFIISNWACRDNGCGDSLGEDTCGNSSYLHNWDDFESSDMKYDHPTYKRLYDWMIKNYKTPVIWNGEKILTAPKPISKHISEPRESIDE